MPFNTNHKIQIVDASGDACDDDSGRLNVNATIGIGSTLFRTLPQDTATTSAQSISTLIGETITTCKEIIIQADFDNASFIMVGDGSVSGDDTRGIRLQAGDMISLPISTTASISVRGPDTSQKYNVIIIT